MANNKRKDLGIGSFIESVKDDQPAATPRKTTTAAAPTTPRAPQTVTRPTPAATPTVTANQQTDGATAYRTPGRPGRTQSLLSKKLAKLVYIDEETELQLKLIKTFQNYDYKEVIFTAIHEFMENHYKDMRLDDSGTQKVEKIIREYKTRS
jgi:hypothetical protein